MIFGHVTAEALAVEVGGLITLILFLAACLRGIVKIVKTIDGQLEAMHDNTEAVTGLTKRLDPLVQIVEDHDDKITILDSRVDGVETRVEYIERQRRMSAVEGRVDDLEHPPPA